MSLDLGRLGYGLADYYALATLVLLGAGAAMALLRQPARRMAVGRAAIGGLLALLAIGLIPAWPRSRVLGPVARPDLAPSPDGGRAIGPIAAGPAGMAPAAAARQPEASKPEPVLSPAEAEARRLPAAIPGWRTLAGWSFLAGAGLMVAWLAVGSWQAAALRLRSRRPEEGVRELLSRVVGEGGVVPELLVNDLLHQPVAVGVLRPAIILPARFVQGEPEHRLEAALAHEWAHIRNRDLWLVAASRLLLPVLYAHPAYWWLRRRIRDDQEVLADAAAAGVEGRLSYAEVLLAWSRGVSAPAPFATGGSLALFERPSQIKRRIVMLLDHRLRVEPTCPAGWQRGVSAVAAAAVLGLSLVTLRPAAAGAGASGAPTAAGVETVEEMSAMPGGTAQRRGRLLGPDGKPFAGAKVYLSHQGSGWNRRPAQSDRPALIGTTADDGTFGYPEEARPEVRWLSQPVVKAEGYGPAFAEPEEKGDVATFRLVKDDVPLRGRVLDIQGRPVAGATVQVVGVLWHPGGSLDPWIEKLKAEKTAYPVEYSTLKSWSLRDVPGLFPPGTTDAEGRFTVTGLGRERIASLLISGPGIETRFEYAATRPMATMRYPDFPGNNGSHDVTYHGTGFDLVVGPGLEATGTVTDKDTGSPLAGAVVETAALFGNPLRTLSAVTDGEGRYRLIGIPPKTQFNDDQSLLVSLAGGPPYLPTVKPLGKPEGGRPIAVDFQLKRGVWATGRVVEKGTGQGVKANFSYYILADNPHAKSYPPYGTIRAGMPNETEPDGTFKLAVMPGPGVIGVRVGNEHYRLGAGAEKIPGPRRDGGGLDMIPAEPGYLMPKNYHSLGIIDPKVGDESVSLEIALDRGKTVRGKVVDPDGRPVTGFRVEGLQDHFRMWTPKPLPTDEFVVEGIGEGSDRDVLVCHEGLRLAGSYVIKPDEAGPIVVRLEPAGRLSGRIVDAAGLPMAEADLVSFNPFGDAKHERAPFAGPVKTDKDGRFRAEALIPGRKYNIKVQTKGRLTDVANDVVVKSGESKDLGDLTVKMGD
ncbi:Regulatory protein BlaR1 [Aquisphaera giovannonii]|uniref:Regulatory protein BlaR1 n=1 Tax=Aquisphaera giovannonii TaxID=406548 RepID=A0A5B9WDP4_9BACT|nr:M56 family metallopeptidase [Aquisphaera giovannonii]QEH38573.1 Regulatory protein BlaR1 [Aquisphaera giovannonii]